MPPQLQAEQVSPVLWTLRKRYGHWCLTVPIYHVFPTFEDAINWVETQRHQEPTA